MKVTRKQLKIHTGTPHIVEEEEVEDIAVVLLGTVLLLLYRSHKQEKLGKYGGQH